MYIVVTNRSDVMPNIQASDGILECWSNEEFIEKATSGDVDVDDGIYFHTEVLTKDLYDLLIDWNDYITYYHFDDESAPSFDMSSNPPQVFELEKPKSEPEPEIAPIPETPVYRETDPVQTTPVQPQQYTPQPEQPPVQPAPVQSAPQPYVTQSEPQFIQQTPVQHQQVPQQVQQVQPEVPTKPEVDPYSGLKVAGKNASENAIMSDAARKQELTAMLTEGSNPESNKKNRKAAKVILFGSSKGGTGKTFTCLASAYWYAKQHPKQRIALADFDIIDGQIGITLTQYGSTLQDYYPQYKSGRVDIDNLKSFKVRSDKFTNNIDIYLAPQRDIKEITEDNDYWQKVFELLITNYDVVFFDSGIDYLGKLPISRLYQIADKIIITCNPSINSVRSVIKQMQTLDGTNVNNVFRKEDGILDRVNIVLTRVSENKDVNEIVVESLSKFAPIIAAFGNIDKIISRVQWYQQWYLIDSNDDITNALDAIVSFEEDAEDE